MNVIDRVGNRHHVLHRHLDELRVAARMTAIAEHFVRRALVVAARQARRAAAAAHAGLQHHALADAATPAPRSSTTSPATSLPEMCGIGMLHVLEAAALPQIEMVQRARAHAHQHFAGTGSGSGASS